MKYTLISHFYNEEFLLPFFVRHHLPIFDHAILIDYGSTDRSVEIIRELAPHWEVRPSEYAEFDSRKLDEQVMAVERELTGWRFALNVTEFLMCADIRERLSNHAREGCSCIAMDSVVLVDHPQLRPYKIDPGTPLYVECDWGYVDSHHWTRRPRYTHAFLDGAYHHGRHGTYHPHVFDPMPLIFWYGWSPFDLLKPRKLQIQTKMSVADKQYGFGKEHVIDNAGLEAEWLRQARNSYELMDDERYRRAVDPYLKELA